MQGGPLLVINGPIIPINRACKRPYKRVTGIITLLLGVITPLSTGRGPPCITICRDLPRVPKYFCQCVATSSACLNKTGIGFDFLHNPTSLEPKSCVSKVHCFIFLFFVPLCVCGSFFRTNGVRAFRRGQVSVRSAEVERCRFGCSLMMTTSPFRSTWTGVWREVVCFFCCAEKPFKWATKRS